MQPSDRASAPQDQDAAPPGAQAAALGPASYDERLTAPRAWWVIAALLGLSGGLVVLPLGPVPALAAVIAAGAVAAAAVSAYGSARVRVVAGSLVAGGARIPAAALGEPEALDVEEARAWRTHRADPRAFMLLRSYVPTAVRVPVTDPEDPTPYVYVSTRAPERLAAALRQLSASAAPSED